MTAITSSHSLLSEFHELVPLPPFESGGKWATERLFAQESGKS